MKELIHKLKSNWKTLIILFFFILFLNIYFYVFYILFAINHHKDLSYQAFINSVSLWDCGWYKGIVDKGYGIIHKNDGQANWAFFPLYPLLVKTAKIIIPIDTYFLGHIISIFLLYCSSNVFFKYIKLTNNINKIQALMLTMLFLINPFIYYCFILYTESLFILLILLFMYFMKTKKFILMGIIGALASATRNIGILFCFIALIYSIISYINENKEKKENQNYFKYILDNPKLILGVCLIPVGLFSYMLFLQIKTGDAFAFLHVQTAWGRNKTIIENFKSLLLNYRLLTIVLFNISCLIPLFITKKYEELVLPLLIILVCSFSGFHSINRYLFSAISPIIGLAVFINSNKNVFKLKITYISILSFLFLGLSYYRWISYDNPLI